MGEGDGSAYSRLKVNLPCTGVVEGYAARRDKGSKETWRDERRTSKKREGRAESSERGRQREPASRDR
jgi:hypothetical protein